MALAWQGAPGARATECPITDRKQISDCTECYGQCVIVMYSTGAASACCVAQVAFLVRGLSQLLAARKRRDDIRDPDKSPI
jgi:hypothetical protein